MKKLFSCSINPDLVALLTPSLEDIEKFKDIENRNIKQFYSPMILGFKSVEITTKEKLSLDLNLNFSFILEDLSNVGIVISVLRSNKTEKAKEEEAIVILWDNIVFCRFFEPVKGEK